MLVPCPHCPCWFATQTDLDAHLKVYTRDPYTHKFKFAMQSVGKPKIPCLNCSRLNVCRLNPAECVGQTHTKTLQTKLK
jgi:hypothetical protein